MNRLRSYTSINNITKHSFSRSYNHHITTLSALGTKFRPIEINSKSSNVHPRINKSLLHSCPLPFSRVLSTSLSSSIPFSSPMNTSSTRSFSSQGGGQGGSWRNPDAIPPGENLKLYTRNLTDDAKEHKLDPVIGRDDVIRRAIQVLCRRTKNNPVFIGEPGVGKTAIAEGLARRIVAGDVPESMKKKQIFALDLASMIAGASYRGQFEERLKGVLKDINDLQGEGILFIDELHMLVSAGAAEGAIDAANILKPALARGELRCMGATTLDEYRKYIEKDAALARRFQSIVIDEPTVEDTISILRGLQERYENHHGVRISDNAIVSAARLAHRYLSERKMPDKAIDLVDEAAARLRMQQESKPEAVEILERKLIRKQMEVEALKRETDSKSKARLKILETSIAKLKKEERILLEKWEEEKKLLTSAKDIKKQLEDARLEVTTAQRRGDYARAGELMYSVIPDLEERLNAENVKKSSSSSSSTAETKMLSDTVTATHIADVVAKATGIPVGNLLEGESDRLLQMEDRLRERVLGQDKAISTIANCVRLSRTGLRAHDRPMGVFLLLGPTGVGKTELSKALSEFLFQEESAMVRIDMSEYMEKHSVSRLIGAPPGYVGYEEGGALTEAVRRKPYQIILFDEFEKAHREVANLLLQVFDEGRLTDSHGRTVDFRNTVIILTSNLGSELLSVLPEGISATTVEKDINSVVQQNFPPEFINRLDDTILFDRLGRDVMGGIVAKEIRKLTKLLEDQDIVFAADDKSCEYLGNIGYSPIYGARPLKRTITDVVLNPLAKLILEGKVKKGNMVNIKLISLDEFSADSDVILSTLSEDSKKVIDKDEDKGGYQDNKSVLILQISEKTNENKDIIAKPDDDIIVV